MEAAVPRQRPKPMPTIWRVPDNLWLVVQRVLTELDPPKRTGRRRIDPRGALDAIIFRVRSGCQWNRLPREFPDDSSVHRTLQRWIDRGVFERIWAVVQEACEDLGGCDWEWQGADGALRKARLGGTSWAPTPLIGPSPA